MIIQPRTKFHGTHKMWSLDPKLSAPNITKLLGGHVKPTKGSADGKCTFTWDFYADGQPCGIWDYKGCRWSGYGPEEVFKNLGMF